MKRVVNIIQSVEVEIDESKFTPQFMAAFRKDFYQFRSVDDHIKHIASIYVRNLYTNVDGEMFIEGYGLIKQFGIRFVDGGSEEEFV